MVGASANSHFHSAKPGSMPNEANGSVAASAGRQSACSNEKDLAPVRETDASPQIDRPLNETIRFTVIRRTEGPEPFPLEIFVPAVAPDRPVMAFFPNGKLTREIGEP